MADDLLKDLNDAQREAVTHTGGPLLIVAGAGTGKTAVIARRIAWLIREGHAKPEEILALTFTEKAAGELEERVDRLLPYGYVDLWIQTFHAFGERILRLHGLDIGLATSFRVLSDPERWMLLRRHFTSLDLSYYRPLGNPTKFLDALLTHFSRAEDELVTPDDYDRFVKDLFLSGDAETASGDEARHEEIARCYRTYKRLLREEGALDFSDLINEALRLFRERPAILDRYRSQFKYILVDEFQDTNWAQYELVKLLAGERRSVTVVGDDDQSIYKFRGASVSNILDFGRDFSDAKRVVLTENYRSRQEILDFAYRFIQKNNPDRLEAALEGAISKRLASVRGTGGSIRHLHGKTLGDEARLVAERIAALRAGDPEGTWNDFAILVRANDHAEPFLQALRMTGIPHEFVASRGLYLKPVTLDILSYLRLLDDYHESRALARVLCAPNVHVSPEDLVALTHEAGKKAESLYETTRRAGTVSGISEEGRTAVERLVGFIEKHARLSTAKNVDAVILAFLNETGYLRSIANQGEAETRETMRILNRFWQTVESFVKEEPEPTVRAFLERIRLELDAGETGALPADPEAGPEMVRVMTVHASKGLEFRHVFVANLVDKRFPSIARQDAIPLPDAFIHERLPQGDAHLMEERRLFYVACTRAKDSLFLTSGEDYGGARKKKLSRFFSEAQVEIATATSVEPTVEIVPDAPTIGALVIPERMSFSQFEAFERCPLQYKFEHLLRIPKAGNANKSFGQSVHATLQEMLARYMARRGADQGTLFGEGSATKALGELVPADELLEIYRERWMDDWYDSKGQRAERYDAGKKALLAYHARIKDTAIEVAGLEVGFSLKLEGMTVRGRIDRIDRLPDGTVHIIDYKTGRAKEDPKHDQLLIYQLAAQRVLGLKPSTLSFLYLEEGREVSFLGTEEELAGFETHLVSVADAIRKSSFAATPDRMTCRFCDFKDICEFRAS